MTKKTYLSLTARDVELLELLSEHRGVTFEYLAEKLFSENPFTGEKNKEPLKACRRRIATLAAHDYVLLLRGREHGRERVLAAPGSLAFTVIGARAQRSLPVRKQAHHARTLEAVSIVERAIKARAGKVVSVHLEAELRSRATRGRFLRAGDRFEAFPDAVVVFSQVSSGRERVFSVAVEYATSKYTDKDIKEKHESFSQYDRALWFADRSRTSSRVAGITGAPCKTL